MTQTGSAPTSDGASEKAGSENTSSERKIQELEALVKEKENKYLYLYAEFENFKKRAARERAELLKFGWEAAVQELLEVMDNLERALGHMPHGTDQTLLDGLHMVMKQFKAVLEKQGVARIEAVKQGFDPNLHEAVSHEESDAPAGTVVKEHVAGYTLHGRLLRPSRVTVSGGRAG